MNNNDHKQKVKKSFDMASGAYDCHSLRFFNESASHLIKNLNLKGNENLIDIATGTGHVAIAAPQKLTNSSITGIDLSDKMLGKARYKAAEYNLTNVTFKCCDIENMPVSNDYLNYVLDQLNNAGPVVSKKMFGGVGLYLQGIFFALIAGDVLYFKVDESNRHEYEARGMKPFKPFGEKSYIMQYYEVPVDVLEDEDKLKEWAEKALTVALQKKLLKKKKKNRE